MKKSKRARALVDTAAHRKALVHITLAVYTCTRETQMRDLLDFIFANGNQGFNRNSYAVCVFVAHEKVVMKLSYVASAGGMSETR
eukprot:6208396-Pleurochrysis_carterae.AAC.1